MTGIGKQESETGHDCPTLELTSQLIARRSLTPDDAGCCALIGERLQRLGFTLEYLNADGVTNLWARYGTQPPLVVLAGHTDVVPPGPLEKWSHPPFEPTEVDGVLYGRGAADMKSGLATMVCAVERLLARRSINGSIAFLITSDEEGPAQSGTRYVVEQLRERGVKPDYAIVGEATALQQLGDRITIGRRGSLGCNLRVFGRQGHVAYPEKADNPIHRLAPAIAELVATRWDEGNAHFPPTSLQISNFHAGTGATNVIPGQVDLVFNFRYGTASSADGLKARVHAILERHALRYEADWWHSGEPFLTAPGALIDAAIAAAQQITGRTPVLFTGGGTSDGRFIAPWGAQVIEAGPVNDSIHKIDEHVNVADLPRLSALHEQILDRLL